MERAAFLLPHSAIVVSLRRSLRSLGDRAWSAVRVATAFVSRRLTFEQVMWIIIGLFLALFVWFLISGETMTGRGWT